MSLNLKSKAAVDTSTVLLNGTDGEPLLGDDGQQASITVYGPGSKQFAKASAARTNRMMGRMKASGQPKASAEDQQAEVAEYLAAITVSLNHADYEGGTDAESIKAMYADTTLGFIADQVQKHVGDWANFTKGSAKTSPSTSAS